MKVCIVSSWFPSSIDPFSGSFVLAFGKRIKKAGLEVEVITARDKRDQRFDSRSEKVNSIPIYRVNRFLPFLQMFKLIATLKPHIIHVHAPNFFSSFAVVIAKILRIPVVATVHRVEVMPLKSKYMHFVRRMVLSLFDRIVAVSAATRQLTQDCGVDGSKIHIIWNSVEEDAFRPRSKSETRRQLRIAKERDVVLFVGNVVWRKGIKYLICAMLQILQNRDVQLVIVGDGPGRSSLQHLVDSVNLKDNVLFAGHLPTEKLALYYNAADVFVLPSLSEGQSVALLEAMASGLPIVATNVRGNKESVIDKINGFLVSPKDYVELAQAISMILDDENLKQQFSQKSLELYRKNFSERNQLDKYLFIYDKLLKRKFCFSPIKKSIN